MFDAIKARQEAGDEVAKRITFTAAAHAPYTVSDASLAKVKQVSDDLGVPVHIHLHETAGECHMSEHGTGPRERRAGWPGVWVSRAASVLTDARAPALLALLYCCLLQVSTA